eukprot:8414031-Pyramimonas_sp.AAC.1
MTPVGAWLTCAQGSGSLVDCALVSQELAPFVQVSIFEPSPFQNASEFGRPGVGRRELCTCTDPGEAHP